MKTVLTMLVLMASITAGCGAVDAWTETRAASGVLSSARNAMAAEDYERALALYETVLDNPDHDTEVRAEARLNLALVYLANGFPNRNVVEGLNRLADLRDKHPTYRAPEVRTLLQLLMDKQHGVDDASGLSGEISRLQAELAAARNEVERMREAVRQAADSALDDG